MRADRSGADLLDDYVEAQVHGDLRLADDVEAVVLDPSFIGTRVEQAAERLECPVEWHDGFRAKLSDIARHPDYRGREIVALAGGFARDGVLDPRIVGEVARGGEHLPQAVKQLWHCTARFGTPEGRALLPRA